MQQSPNEHVCLPHPAVVRVARFTPDGRSLLTACFDGNVRVWDVGTHRVVRSFEIGELCSALAVSPDGALVAGGNNVGRLVVWEIASGREVLDRNTKHANVYDLAFAPDSGALASANHDGTVSVWPPSEGGPEEQFASHQGRVWAVAYAPDSGVLASGGEDGDIVLHAPGAFAPARRWHAHNGHVAALAFGPGGELHCATLRQTYVGPTQGRRRSLEKNLTVWDVAAPEAPVRAFGAPASHGVAVSADGRLVATAHTGHTVTLWPQQRGKPSRILTGHEDAVFSVAVSPDGRLAASSGADRTARLWPLA